MWKAPASGQSIDYDKLTLEVWTNGVINAQEAVSLAAKVLTDHLNLFVDLSDKGKSTEDHGGERTRAARKRCWR